MNPAQPNTKTDGALAAARCAADLLANSVIGALLIRPEVDGEAWDAVIVTVIAIDDYHGR